MRKNVIDMYYAQAQTFVKVFFAVCLLALGLVPEVSMPMMGFFYSASSLECLMRKCMKLDTSSTLKELVVSE